jgi:hypothetical protein
MPPPPPPLPPPPPPAASASPPPAPPGVAAGSAAAEPAPVARPLLNNAYLEGVLRSAGTLTLSSARASLAAAPHEACARSSAGWGALVGGLVGAHRLKQGGGAGAVARAGAAAAGFTFLTQFVLCRQQTFDAKLAMKLFAQQAAAADRGGGSGGGGGAAQPP